MLVQGRCNNVILSDGNLIVVGKDKRVYVWRMSEEGYRLDPLPAISKIVIKVMVWCCTCWAGGGTLAKVEGNINAQKYETIIDEYVCPVLARHFPLQSYLFQDDITSCA